MRPSRWSPGCADCGRADRARSARAAAGDGLPAIEPGMPAPAGTGLDRRELLLGAAGLLLSAYGLGSTLGVRAVEEGIAQAAALAPPDRPVLVSVFLQGGADGLSMLFPSGDPLYAKLRPTLALGADQGSPVAWDDRLRWHPELAPLATLAAEGKVAVAPAIGNLSPNLSHFTSRHYWETGSTDVRARTGWLGRYLDLVGTPDNPLQGLSLDYALQPSLATASVPIAALDGPDRFTFGVSGVTTAVRDRMLGGIGTLGALAPGDDPALTSAAQVLARSDVLRQTLAPFGQAQPPSPSTTPYPAGPDPFARRLAGIPQMLAAGLPLHCVALTGTGLYDTHGDQVSALGAGLRATAPALLAFQRDLEARGLADRVLTLVWSEFGRRAAENGSAGTDHGAGGVALVIGTRVAGGLLGEFPGLAGGLDASGNLRATLDFRALYAAVIEQWLGADAQAIVPEARGLARPAVVA